MGGLIVFLCLLRSTCGREEKGQGKEKHKKSPFPDHSDFVWWKRIRQGIGSTKKGEVKKKKDENRSKKDSNVTKSP